MQYRKSISERVFEVILYFVLSGLIAITLYPLLYVLFASLSDPASVVQHRGLLLHPLGFNLGAYRLVFENPMIAIGYRNTILYVVGGTALNLVMTTLAAYALSRRNVYWKRPITLLIVFTMFFGGGLIPTFLLVSNTLNLLDSGWALILPSAINTWNLLIMKTSFESLPVALEESARLDGANDFQILLKIAIPLSLPVIAVMVLFYSVAHWNAFFSAMIYLRTRELWPLQLVLREILISRAFGNSWYGLEGQHAVT